MLKPEYIPEKSMADAAEISVITDALSGYFKICSERLKFDLKAEQLLKNAYIGGLGIAYTYWDNNAPTGLFADYSKTHKIKGDINLRILDAENVVFGEPSCEEVERQPYILISEQLDIEAVRREAKQNGLKDTDIIPDENFASSRSVAVITKLFKQYDNLEDTYKIMAVKVTKNGVVKPVWDTGLTRYPLAIFRWESRKNNIYGESEVTHLIPNQIAINRMLTSQCWSALSSGMPKLLINNDIVGEDVKITNDPGQIIRANVGYENNLNNAMQYVAPAPWAEQYSKAINEISSNTLFDAGANDVALGNVAPTNATAIIQMREAALQPMQIYKNRYYAFVEELARVWADFWISKYGNRQIKIQTEQGMEYLSFNAQRYKNLILNATVDVGTTALWSEAVVISTLGNLLELGIITPKQYLERIPKGLVPKVNALISEITENNNTLKGDNNAG